MCSKGPTVRSLRSDSRAFSARAAAKAAASIAPGARGGLEAPERGVVAADVELVTNGGESGEV